MRCALFLFLLLESSNAFLAPVGKAASRGVRMNLSAQEDEVAALRAAAAKAREDAERLAKVSLDIGF